MLALNSYKGAIIILLFISLIMVIVYTVVLCISGKKISQGISTASAKCIAMSYGMISGTAIGLFSGIYLQGELAFSTVASIVISAIFGYFVGRIFGLTGIIEALASSFMGAMMGAMVGEMLSTDSQPFMIIMMDLIYLLVVSGLLFMISSEHKKMTKSSRIKLAPLLIMLLVSFSSISIVAILAQHSVDVEQELLDKMNREHHH